MAWRILTGLCVFGVGVKVSNAKESVSQGEARIVGGQAVTEQSESGQPPITRAPWAARLDIFWCAGADISTCHTNVLCGGSFVAQGWVLTAAHCLRLASGFDFASVSAHIDGVDRIVGRSSASAWKIHSRYDKDKFANDIALMKVDFFDSAEKWAVSPKHVVALASSENEAVHVSASDHEFHVFGWGTTNNVLNSWLDNFDWNLAVREWLEKYGNQAHQLEFSNHSGPLSDLSSVSSLSFFKFVWAIAVSTTPAPPVAELPDVLQWTTVRRFCDRQMPSECPVEMLDLGQLAVGAVGTSACQGDSGGPLVYERLDGLVVQRGLVSYGWHCGMVDSVYTDVAVFREWINEQLPVGQKLSDLCVDLHCKRCTGAGSRQCEVCGEGWHAREGICVDGKASAKPSAAVRPVSGVPAAVVLAVFVTAW